MVRNIQLNSSDWCDIVFTGKNKTYGAYALRQSSSKRHLLAFFIVVIFVGIVAGLPSILNAVNPPKEYVQNITSEYIVGGADELEKEEEPIVKPSTTLPPPPIIDSQKFTPPVVTADDMVEESRELLSQQELNSSTAQISIATMETGNTEGVDIAEVLKEQRQITNQPPQEPNQIHEIVEIMPQFPGGTSELMRYLSANMKYPTIAAENNIEGRVVLKFVVGKDGSISNIQVIRPLDPSCDKEAVRVVRSMSKWTSCGCVLYFTCII
ncbi:energy transducer TonB [Dysgonomonas sp. GY617]|uniref:energy transducer TonB n=1 Tax=Dysgonomonas sp. GY617 TaxID=2780420 RepID=UPI0018834D21|nr:energy transducer TonB [Dysgonomonas sp. GY617]MBF0575383.1 energy transducer TonB [Dysgonomonas sp. GY617]